MSPSRSNLAAFAASAVVSSLAAWAALGAVQARDVDTVAFDDNTDAVAELLDARQAAPPDPEPAPLELAPDRIYLPPPPREPIDEELARSTFFRMLKKEKQFVYQPDALVFWRGGIRAERSFPEHASGTMPTFTNALGFRKNEELRETAPDLRILVAGDSHTAGVVPNDESYANVLEMLLGESHPGRSVESLNAGVPGTSLYNYLGIWEAFGTELDVDVFVVGLYGGNDFMGLLPLHRYFNRLPAPKFKPYGGKNLQQLGAAGPVGQQLGQVAYYLDNPDDEAVTLDAVASITNEIRRQCEEAGARLICLYIPPPYDVQPRHYAHQIEPALETVGMLPEHLAVSRRLADGWIAFLERAGIAYVDLRPLYAAREEPCYWQRDLHINTLGHRIAAEALAGVIEDVRLIE